LISIRIQIVDHSWIMRSSSYCRCFAFIILHHIRFIVCQYSFWISTMLFSLLVFLECIWNINWLSTKILSIHCLHWCIWALKVIITHKSISFGLSCFWISHDLGW
jgi:hypothetical protein